MSGNNKVKSYLNSILNSYSQVFFSENNLFALSLILISFLDFWAGTFGLIAVITANTTASVLGFDKNAVRKGFYGFNALLTGLGTGILFEPGFELVVIVIFAAVMTLFITLALEGVLLKYGLPFLSLPFLFGIWVIILATKDFSSLGLSERSIYTYNDLYALGGNSLVQVYDWFSDIKGFDGFKIYFLSLGAVFFQNNILAGIIISLGLLYYSRIAFSLSLIGFWTAYLFYQLTGSDFDSLSYTFIGFNYILTSIAVGGYFLIPSVKSYLWTILLLPITILITAAASDVFSIWEISIYSLPFNIVVILFVYILKLRIRKDKHLTDFFTKQSTPEKSLYLYHTASEDLKGKDYFPFNLPFKGYWTVSQAHNGEYTHKEQWRHAWDFIITDENGNQFKNKGDFPKDYYCWNKPVFAPAGGIITETYDGVPDNEIGDINTEQNWGNSIVIKHGEYLYSQLSHLKEGSFNVKKGDYVKTGDLLAKVGNSGHSPYPHLHFQIQATPYIGSETSDYPLYNYVIEKNGETDLKTFGKPKKDDLISSAEKDKILDETMHFIPGKKLIVYNEKTNKKVRWEIQKNILNQTFITDENKKNSAWFYENDSGIFFTNFYGNKKSDLFLLFTALNQVKKSFYKNTKINSLLRPDMYFGKGILFIQDFFAPFVIFLKCEYKFLYTEKDDDFNPDFIKAESGFRTSIFGKTKEKDKYKITFFKNGKTEISVNQDFNLTIEQLKKTY